MHARPGRDAYEAAVRARARPMAEPLFATPGLRDKDARASAPCGHRGAEASRCAMAGGSRFGLRRPRLPAAPGAVGHHEDRNSREIYIVPAGVRPLPYGRGSVAAADLASFAITSSVSCTNSRTTSAAGLTSRTRPTPCPA